jgi:glycosyltransferase involved in cell wall biosynthesis
VIVIDNSSSDNTKKIMSSFSNRLKIRVIYEPVPGLSRARNTGFFHARGEYILFTDDDCLVSPNWIQVGYDLLKKNPAQVIGGRVNLYDPQALPMSIKTELIKENFTSTTPLWGFIHGANLATTRDVFVHLQGFDCHLGPGSVNRAAEDTDFFYRAHRSGIPVVYEPDFVVSHDHRRKGVRELFTLQRSYSRGMGAMAAKHFCSKDNRPLKELYWDLRSTVKASLSGTVDFRLAMSKLYSIPGFFNYILYYRQTFNNSRK